MKRIYNLIRDEKDIRDFRFNKKVIMKNKKDLPIKYSLSPLPLILDQGDLGSCTANAASNGLLYLLDKNDKPEFQPSRLFIYWFTRFIQNSVSYDSGASLRNTMKSIGKYGACNENIWEYDISKYKIKPSNQAVTDGAKHKKGFQYLSVGQDTSSIKNAISQGYPIVCGILVYSSFESDEVTKTGNVPMPDTTTEDLLGGHAILMVSYDDTTKKFGFMNSWGTSWGNKGFFTLPYDYIFNYNLAFDFWTIRYFA